MYVHSLLLVLYLSLVDRVVQLLFFILSVFTINLPRST